jgi:O-acetyl-ADP-ribose deacetylase (regulator of RNase III)/uncharacterized protein YwgA
LIGDIFQSKAKTIVNTVNCVGVMGKGIAAQFKKRFPDMYHDYRERCDTGRIQIGKPYLYSDKSGVSIINFPTKNHWRSPSQLDDIAHGLDAFVAYAKDWGITSVAMPPLGCGNGGLEWSVVGPLMYQKLSILNISIEIYAPYGTPQSQLTLEFLKQPVTEKNLQGSAQQKMNPAWMSILEVVNQLAQQPFANPVGRTILQKIAYVLTEQGANTGFHFKQGSYGPFSEEMQEALKVLTNANLIKEQMLGRMMAIHIGCNYDTFKEKYQDVLSAHDKWIKKTVDLFSRIKSTEQAEEVTTVLYASRDIKKTKHNVSEQDLYDHILKKWKKRWDESEKRESIANTIRNLEMLGWMRLQYSETLVQQ